ncbi:MAG: GerW family sporulation protein [Acetobacteraceae bacterium]|nr:GerW family sporulation protein [Acetobacteraceae bacterium]
MREHPIQGLMKTAMESIKGMVDVNTVVGDPVEAQDGSVIMPVSRVSFGFAAGGGEYLAGAARRGRPERAPAGSAERGSDEGEERGPEHPFAGGSGAGITVQPVAFLVVGQGTVRLLPVDSSALYDRLIDLAPQILDRLRPPGRTATTGAGGFGGGGAAPVVGGPVAAGSTAGGAGGGGTTAGGPVASAPVMSLDADGPAAGPGPGASGLGGRGRRGMR